MVALKTTLLAVRSPRLAYVSVMVTWSPGWTGVGFTAQGNFVGSYYRVRPEASDPRVSWILDGIREDKIGDFGLSGHGAAGFELDRTDKRLGTPAHALVIAASENHPPEAPWILVPEEQLTHITTIAGKPAQELIRADMTFFETPNNGAVFSTGSITFCGSLPTNNFENNWVIGAVSAAPGIPAESMATGHGIPHSDKYRVTERYTPIDANTIHYEAVITDENVFTQPWTLAWYAFARAPKDYVPVEYACFEGNANNIMLMTDTDIRGVRVNVP